MNIHRSLFVVIALFWTSMEVSAASVELNVVPSSRASYNAAQEWARELAKLKSVRVRIGGGRDVERPEVKRSGSTVHITAVIDSRNQLVVPGARFSIRQRASLQSWIDQQRNSKSTDLTKDRFGLTAKELQQCHDALKSTVSKSTKGQSVDSVVQNAARVAGLEVQFSSGARRRLATAKMADEWQGFTGGTVIAAALRPHELVMTPKMDSGRLTLVVSNDTAVDESWPVGWKSKLKPSELVPKFYDPLPIEVEKTAIADVMTALEGRLETAIFYDSALLTLLELEPTTKKVSYSADRTTYLKTVKTCLYKAGMKYEIRVDERGKPFFWISPRRLPSSKNRKAASAR